jgi:hypothetical protein
MGPEGVALPAPAVGQALGLSHRGEQLGVEEFVSEPAVERLCKAVLPRGSWLDIGGGGAAGLAPALEGVGNELGAVIAADERRRRVDAGELLQHRHHILGLAAPAHPDRQAETAVLVDHIQELESAAISGGVELEIHGPHLVGMLSPVTPDRAVRGPCPLSLQGSGPLQTLLAPESLHPLVIHGPALSPQQAVGHAPPPADVLRCDLAEPMAELCLLQVNDPAGMALGAAVLPHNPACQTP